MNARLDTRSAAVALRRSGWRGGKSIAASEYAARVGAGWMLHWRAARQVVFMARVFPTCTKSAVAQRSRRIGEEGERASCEGGGREEGANIQFTSLRVRAPG